MQAQAVWIFSLWGSSFSSILFPQGHLDKKAVVVQHPSEPLKGQGILWAGAKSLKTRCRCVASKRGMGGELREEKTHSSPISTTQSRIITPWYVVQPQSYTDTSVERQFGSQVGVLARQNQCVMGTAGKRQGKGKIACCSGHWQGLGERIWIGTWLSSPAFSHLCNPTTS